jgi:hypothetical protein
MANSSAIILHSKFDPANQMLFSPLQKSSKGQKIVYINQANKQKVRVQTPPMRAIFGLSRFDDANTGASSFSLDLSFNGREENPKLDFFLTKLREMDQHLLTVAQERSTEWFGKEMSKEILSEFHRPSVRDPSDPKYQPTVRLKVTGYSEIYDEEHERVDMDQITKGALVRAIVEPSFWIVNKSFGISLRILQLEIISRPAGVNGFAFQEEEDETMGTGDDDDKENAGQAFL